MRGNMIHLMLPCSSSDSRFMSLILSLMEDLLRLVFFMASHPLQLAYIFFFLPYIIRMFSLFFPLLLTTCLFLLVFLTVDGSSLTLPEFFGRTCRILLESLKHEVDGDFPSLDDDVGDVGLLGCFFSNLETCFDCVVGSGEEERTPIEADDDGNSSSFREEKVKEEKVKKEGKEEDEVKFFKPTFPSNGIIGWNEFEAIGKLYKALTNEVGEYPIKVAIRNLKKKQPFPSKHGNADSPEEVGHLEGWETPSSNLEWPMAEFDVEKDGNSRKGIGFGELVPKSLERYGSARREMEWKRTLASKLYQERWSVGGAKGDLEGMDLLWEETNEVASADVKDDKKRAMEKRSLSKKKSGKKGKKNKEKDGERNTEELKEEEDDDDDEDEEEKEIVGHICCLQALKFPRGRMSFGLGKVSKLSKATKAFMGGMGIFHSSGKKIKKP